MKEFYCKTKIICGSGAVSMLKDLQAGRLFLISDPFFQKNGTADRLAALSGAEAVEVFSDIVPDPSVTLAATGTAKLKAFDPDLVVALGGGSAMDCAKAMVYFSQTKAKFVAIPTTSGSGSEVTDFAILTHDDVKHPLVDPRLAPDVAILDDELLQQLPKKLITDAGYDVLAHALESFVAKGASPMTEALAKEAFCRVYALLSASYAGQQSVRLEIHTAATMAGMAFTRSGLGLCHAMAHVLGGMYHVSHGRLNGILLPAVIGCNAHAAASRYAQIARSAAISGSADSVTVRNLKNGLIRLRRELDMPGTLQEAGVDPRQVWNDADNIVKAVLSDPCCCTNPMAVDDLMVHQVLETVMGHG